MKRIFHALVVLGLAAAFAGPADAQCRNGNCRAVPMGAAPAFAIEPHASDRDWSGLYFGNVQVAALCMQSGEVHPIDPKTGQFIDLAGSVVGQAAGEGIAAPGPQGLDRRGILREGERYTMNGELATAREALWAVRASAGVPDDSAAPSLTLIGSEDECQSVLKALKADGAGADAMSRYLVQSFRPGNALVSGAGFVLDGKPSIYGQLPDGRTLFRAAGMVDIGELAGAMVRGIEIAEGKRAPDPGYNPQADAGLVIKPQVDAKVEAPSWMYAITHVAAMLAGGLGALGGRWALVSLLLTPALTALEQRMLAKIQPPGSGVPAPPAPPSPSN